MSRSLRHSVISLFIVLAWGSGWLMLWTLGFYLTHNGQQAALFLPHGVYLALLILLSRRYWPALVLPPVLMLFWLHGEQLLNGYILLAAPLIGLLPAGIAQQFWHRFPLYWQRLTLLLATVTASALLNTALLSPFVKSPAMMLGLASFTGGVLLTPFVYLIFEFLRQQHRYHLLGLDTNNPPLRTSLIIWCSLFFIIGIGTQMVLSPEIERLLLIVVFLPNVVMAWKFGWQGGVLSGLLGSMMITIARQVGVGFSNLVELEIFLATQALLGIGLGIAISRQQHLAQNLHHYRQRLEAELAARRALTEKLIHTEEDTRKSLARELHDEIGQNITAIQIQSQLVKRARDPAQTQAAASQINDLARRIHHSTRQLLRQLRPRPLMNCRLKRRCTICSMSLPLPSAVSAAALTTGSPPRRRAKRYVLPSIGCYRSCLTTSVNTPTPARLPLLCISRGRCCAWRSRTTVSVSAPTKWPASAFRACVNGSAPWAES